MRRISQFGKGGQKGLRGKNEGWAGPQNKELYQTMEQKYRVWKPTGNAKWNLQLCLYSIEPDEMVKLNIFMQSPIFQCKSVEEDMNCGKQGTAVSSSQLCSNCTCK